MGENAVRRIFANRHQALHGRLPIRVIAKGPRRENHPFGTSVALAREVYDRPVGPEQVEKKTVKML
jgi:hypothetical protein